MVFASSANFPKAVSNLKATLLVLQLSFQLLSKFHPLDITAQLPSFSLLKSTSMSIDETWSETGDPRVALLQETESNVQRKVKSVWSGFTDFALRDNVLEVAVGLMYAGFLIHIVKLH